MIRGAESTIELLQLSEKKSAFARLRFRGSSFGVINGGPQQLIACQRSLAELCTDVHTAPAPPPPHTSNFLFLSTTQLRRRKVGLAVAAGPLVGASLRRREPRLQRLQHAVAHAARRENLRARQGRQCAGQTRDHISRRERQRASREPSAWCVPRRGVWGPSCSTFVRRPVGSHGVGVRVRAATDCSGVWEDARVHRVRNISPIRR